MRKEIKQQASFRVDFWLTSGNSHCRKVPTTSRMQCQMASECFTVSKRFVQTRRFMMNTCIPSGKLEPTYSPTAPTQPLPVKTSGSGSVKLPRRAHFTGIVSQLTPETPVGENFERTVTDFSRLCPPFLFVIVLCGLSFKHLYRILLANHGMTQA